MTPRSNSEISRHNSMSYQSLNTSKETYNHLDHLAYVLEGIVESRNTGHEQLSGNDLLDGPEQ